MKRILFAVLGIPFLLLFRLIEFARLKVLKKKRRLFSLGCTDEIPLITLWKVQWKTSPFKDQESYTATYNGYFLRVWKFCDSEWIFGYWEPVSERFENVTHDFAEDKKEAMYRCIEQCQAWIESGKQLETNMAC